MPIPEAPGLCPGLQDRPAWSQGGSTVTQTVSVPRDACDFAGGNRARDFFHHWPDSSPSMRLGFPLPLLRNVSQEQGSSQEPFGNVSSAQRESEGEEVNFTVFAQGRGRQAPHRLTGCNYGNRNKKAESREVLRPRLLKARASRPHTPWEIPAPGLPGLDGNIRGNHSVTEGKGLGYNF